MEKANAKHSARPVVSLLKLASLTRRYRSACWLALGPPRPLVTLLAQIDNNLLPLDLHVAHLQYHDHHCVQMNLAGCGHDCDQVLEGVAGPHLQHCTFLRLQLEQLGGGTRGNNAILVSSPSVPVA